MKIFYDPKHILYIAGSLRESCKILTKEFNKEFLPGFLTEHPVHHLVCFSVGVSVRPIQDAGFMLSSLLKSSQVVMTSRRNFLQVTGRWSLVSF